MIELAKSAMDVGLATNRSQEHGAFWSDEAGFPLEGVLKISENQNQWRYDALGSIVKVNGFAPRLTEGIASGYRELLIARKGISAPTQMQGPDGVRLSLVPPGHEGIGQIAMRVSVSNLDMQRRFYRDVLCLPEEATGCFRVGESLLIVEQCPSDKPGKQQSGTGWRYITLQVVNALSAHTHALACGAAEAKPLVRLGDVARYSIIRDPDGNAVELSQRASLTGSLN